ncbi:fibronectin type III domain-containing protein [Flavobacterium phycosphaerae]|uniref:fibronectin type III domain-containing protein n=1 Tax=Flavobacterium phycosphaerae TaxID=2697515 RepID=UPI00138A59A4|nr:fibronectin type III domain-containing protein [Flavobacterium phycosphaerae]
MNKIKFFTGLFLIFTAITFNSCETEPIDSAIDLDDFNQPTCNAPSAFQASSFINNNSISLSWVAGGDETTWTIEYGAQGFVQGTGTSVIATTTTYVVTGLNFSNSYSFYVKANCSADSGSQWVGPVNVQGVVVVNPNCPNPSNLTATRDTTTNTNVNVTWTAGATETSWEIQYGMTGFVVGTGTPVTSTTTSKLVSGVSATVAYDFYVRATCSATQNSSWIGPITVSAAITNPTTPVAYMNATVNGQPFTGMKPYYYPFTGLKAKQEISSLNEDRILVIQGDTDPLNPTPNNFVQINIKINKQYWAPGTYQVNPDNPTDPEKIISADIIIVNATNPWDTYEDELQGTFTITEFNPATKRIKGTFSFPYMLNDANDVVTGPFQVTNGSFDFECEDAIFLP